MRKIEETLNKMFWKTVTDFGSKPGMLWKTEGAYQPILYKDIGETVIKVGSALISLGFQKEQMGAILSTNRPEWVYADMGILNAGGISVPIYPTLKPKQITYMLEETEARFLFVEDEEQLEKIYCIKDKLPSLQLVILMEGTPGIKEEWLLTFSEFLELGKHASNEIIEELRNRSESRIPQDIATIIYTSGTTGVPKGVMLTHGNFIANIRSSVIVHKQFNENHVCLSFLPLSHILERTAGYYLQIFAGTTIAYAESILTVPENMKEVHPTIVISVPRLYEKIYSRIKEQIETSSPALRKVFLWSIDVGKKWFHAKMTGIVNPLLSIQHILAEKLVYRKIREQLGGKLQFFVSGGAPLEASIGEFFAACNIMIYEGYGLTETAPITNVNPPRRIKFGTVGPAVPDVDVKIAEDGEILVKGPNVMKGYFKKPFETAEVFTSDGWFKTGDIGVIDTDGYLRITDRKKELIITSGGKNIAPQPIENHFKTSPFISQIMLVGDRRKYLAALIVPNFEKLESWARSQKLSYKDRSELVALPQIERLMEDTINEMQREFPRFEQIKRFHLLSKEFSIDSGELTPTLKMKRKVIIENYREIIEALYPLE